LLKLLLNLPDKFLQSFKEQAESLAVKFHFKNEQYSLLAEISVDNDENVKGVSCPDKCLFVLEQGLRRTRIKTIFLSFLDILIKLK